MLHRTNRSITLAAAICVGSALAFSGCGGGGDGNSDKPKAPSLPSSGHSTPAPKADGGSVAQGKTLYETNCSVCHGASGKGDGVGAKGLVVKPRDLTSEPYKFVPVATASNEAEALVEYLKVGRIESGMPPFAHLKPEELKSLALFVESIRPKPNYADEPAAGGEGGGEG